MNRFLAKVSTIKRDVPTHMRKHPAIEELVMFCLYCLKEVVRLVGGSNVVKNLAHVLDLKAAIDMLANHDYRSKTAGTHTTQAVERELTVRSRLAHLDIEDALDLFQQTLGTAHVASGSQAD